jgi:hypothetical protein
LGAVYDTIEEPAFLLDAFLFGLAARQHAFVAPGHKD